MGSPVIHMDIRDLKSLAVKALATAIASGSFQKKIKKTWLFSQILSLPFRLPLPRCEHFFNLKCRSKPHSVIKGFQRNQQYFFDTLPAGRDRFLMNKHLF